MLSPSYSSWNAPASCLENAHCGPRPRVPGLNATTGRGPGPGHGACGTATVPDTAILAPCTSVDTYWTFQACIGMLPGTSVKVTGSQASSAPGAPPTRSEERRV